MLKMLGLVLNFQNTGQKKILLMMKIISELTGLIKIISMLTFYLSEKNLLVAIPVLSMNLRKMKKTMRIKKIIAMNQKTKNSKSNEESSLPRSTIPSVKIYPSTR